MKYILTMMALMLCIYSTHAQTIDTTNTSHIFTFVERMPKFPGGNDSMNIFLAKKIIYPAEAKRKHKQGIVYIQFIVYEDGTISHIKVLRDIGGGCANEAVRVVKLMPKWEPGKQNGKAVKVSLILPVKFTLPVKKAH